MKSTHLVVSSVVFLAFSAPAQALDLGVSLGSLDVGVSVGHGSVASVGVGIGGSGSGSSGTSVGVDIGGSDSALSVGVGVGGSDALNVDVGLGTPGTSTGTSTGTSRGQVGTVAVARRENLAPQLLKFASYLGREVLSRDRVMLGTVTDLKPSGGGARACPVLGMSPSGSLPISSDRVWLRMSTCNDAKGAINIGMTSGSFVDSVRN